MVVIEMGVKCTPEDRRKQGLNAATGGTRTPRYIEDKRLFGETLMNGGSLDAGQKLQNYAEVLAGCEKSGDMRLASKTISQIREDGLVDEIGESEDASPIIRALGDIILSGFKLATAHEAIELLIDARKERALEGIAGSYIALPEIRKILRDRLELEEWAWVLDLI